MALQFLQPMVEVGFVTDNIDKMLPFYRDLLALPFIGHLEYPGGQQYRFACGDSVLKLVIPDPLPTTKAAPGGAAGATGIRYISFGAANLRELVAEVRAAGLAVPVDVTPFNPTLGFAFITDPDGNWIEVFGPI